jgi:WD40 repeat protein
MRSRSTISVVRFAVLSLALLTSAAQADPKNKLAAAVMANIGDLSDAGDVMFSPNGQLVAIADSGYRASRITLWDVASGRPLRILAYRALFMGFSFTPDRTSIASAHKDGAIKLWDVETGATTATLRGRQLGDSEDANAIRSLWIDEKGELLVSGDDETGGIAVWNIAQRKQLNTFRLAPVDTVGNRPSIVAARLSADRSQLIALAHDSVNAADSVHVFDLRTGKASASFKLPKDHSFAENGMLGEDAFLVRVSRAECKINRLVLFSLRDQTNFIDVYTPATCVKPEEGALSEAPKLFPGPGGTQLVMAQEGDPELKVWDARTRRVERTIHWPDDAAAKGVIGVARDFKLAATQDANKVRIRDFATGAPVKELTTYGYPAENAVATKDGRYILLSHEQGAAQQKQKDLELWKVDALSPRRLHVSASGDMQIHDVSSDAGVALGGNENGEIFLFSTESGSEQRRVSLAGFKTIAKARLSPDGKMMLAWGEAAIQQGECTRHITVLAHADDGKILRSFIGRDLEDDPTSVAFSADGRRFAVGRRNGTAEIWSAEQANRLRLLPAYENDGDTWSLAFSRDGRLLIGSSLFDEKVFVWNTATGRLVRTFDLGTSRAHYRHASVTAVSRDGKLVAAGLAQRAISSGDIGVERGGIKVWDAATGKLRFTLRGHEGAVYALTFSPDDR